MTRIWVLCAAVGFVVGCGRSGFEAGIASGDGASIPEPHGSPGVEPAELPFVPDTGDGHHGAGVFAGAHVLDLCVPLVEAEGTRMRFAGAAPFTNGDRVLLHQVQDAVPVGGMLGRAGTWTVVRVTDLVGDTARLDRTVPRFESLPPEAAAQACLTPEFTGLDVDGRVAPRPWDGASGGVLVFFVRGSATLDGVDVSGAGFRGGSVGPVSDERPDADDVPLGAGGGKGEGLRGGTLALGGRGTRSSEGGGGNGRSAGGGGGGNAGAGGGGGWETSELSSWTMTAAGHPGRAATGTAFERLTFGGGGGAGQQDDGNAGEGGDGGGAIVVFAGAIAGPLDVRADGERGGQGGRSNSFGSIDGAGGGGAGGTILLWSANASSVSSSLVCAAGGDGGHAVDADDSRRSGPGGGGGGGRVHVEGIAGAIVIVSGGSGGASNGVDWGATGGAAGEALQTL